MRYLKLILITVVVGLAFFVGSAPASDVAAADPAQFDVLKDFVPDSGDSVTVTLICDTGVVTPASASASEGSPAVFSVTGFTPDPNCTATESPIPTGYTSSGTCNAVLEAVGQCTITNNLQGAAVFVFKDFERDSAANVSISLVCSSGDITINNPTASEANPANFVVTDFDVGANCTATESAPDGYIVDESNCASMAIIAGANASCTITNTETQATINVEKNFVPDNGADVDVNLLCTSGIVASSDTTASEADDANFTVTRFNVIDTLCTASEIVPDGWLGNTGDCVNMLISDEDVITCKITNCTPKIWFIPAGDEDCDGFSSNEEVFIGTDPNVPCGGNSWPPDFDNNLTVNTTDVFQVLPPVLGSSTGSQWYSQRADLHPNGVINTTDVFRVLPPILGSICVLL